jgi:uncharacterized membrane protein
MFEIIVAWTYALYLFFCFLLLFVVVVCFVVFVGLCCVSCRTEMFFSQGSQQLFHHVLHHAGIEEIKELRLI